MGRLFRLLCCVYLSALIHVAQSQPLGLSAGDKCTMHDGEEGKCTAQNQCVSISLGVKDKTFNRKDIKICSFGASSPVICCPVTETTLSVTAADATKKYVEKCEDYSSRKYASFAGGHPTELGEFPHMAAIGFQDSQDPNRIHYVCGGALISERFILTAAHCFVKREFKATTVKLGRAELKKYEKPEDDEEDGNPHIDIAIKNITRHPDYDRQKKYNDIALIELEKDVNFTYFARPACLHQPGKEINSQLYITGWGRVSSDNDALSGWLLKSALNETDFNACKTNYDAYLGQSSLPDGLQSSSQLCATGRKGDQIIDTCQGDSGGPLQYKVKNTKTHNDIGYIYGLVSFFGAACANEEYMGVYTRVSHYLDWIQSIVWP